MNKQTRQVASFIGLAENLKHKRYRLGIALGPPSSGKSQIAKAACDQPHALYIDATTDLLPKVVMPDFFPTLGAYDRGDFKDWILEKSYQPELDFVIIDNIEPLLATFGQIKATKFFQIASIVEPLAPVILVTYLIKQVKDANFPTERLLNL